ncbi:MAG: baseplate J/gp47 family protein [Novosphingobium sp.]
MTFTRPTLSEVITRIRTDIKTRLPGADAALRHSVLDVLARAEGGVAAGLYGYLDWLARQLMPDTAEAAHLARWASIWGIERKAATPARASATATGTNGSTIPAGTEAQRVDGMRYTVLEAVTIAAGTATVSIEAVDAGPDAALSSADELTLSSAIGGINATITVTEASAGGTAEEDDDSLLARLLDRIRTPPQGGSEHDYVAWALAQPGVTRAWAYRNWMGLGTVGLSFVMDDREDILPLEADVAAVQAAIEELRPVTAELYVFAPTASPVDIVLRVAPDTPAVRAAIESELADFFSREGEPGGTIYLSRIGEAISLAEGEFQHTLELPSDDFTAGAGEIPSLGNVVFVS